MILLTAVILAVHVVVIANVFIDILIRCLEGITMKVLLGFSRSVCSVFALLSVHWCCFHQALPWGLYTRIR